MKLWLISRPGRCGYDEFDSAVVAARSEEAARRTHPDGRTDWDGKRELYDSWTEADSVTVVCIGRAAVGIDAGVICASFNAG